MRVRAFPAATFYPGTSATHLALPSFDRMTKVKLNSPVPSRASAGPVGSPGALPRGAAEARGLGGGPARPDGSSGRLQELRQAPLGPGGKKEPSNVLVYWRAQWLPEPSS